MCERRNKKPFFTRYETKQKPAFIQPIHPLKDRLNVDRSRLSSLFHFEKKLTACFFYGILARKRIRIMR